ncbi:hypothetical protein GPJ56_009999 [Histomonas meleagridis]|uniref:uncharacterized protein n=1 Tax=Histomonas meleagridis TaxID=135588 RepID=UPI00355AC5FD|nr:hypothetical protein GPJ56_009999 [Histomonas meleagridis]KAH0803048.1 hypothetical protein GO595_004141 [Histomonas meleagridis]
MSFSIEGFKYDICTKGVKAVMMKYHIGRDRVHEICEMFEIQIRNCGRPSPPVTQEELAYIMAYKQEANVGYQAMANVAKRDPFAPKSLTTWKCKSIYEQFSLFQFNRPEKKKEHLNRFVAKYVNQAWHTDLNYLELLP